MSISTPLIMMRKDNCQRWVCSKGCSGSRHTFRIILITKWYIHGELSKPMSRQHTRTHKGKTKRSCIYTTKRTAGLETRMVREASNCRIIASAQLIPTRVAKATNVLSFNACRWVEAHAIHGMQVQATKLAIPALPEPKPGRASRSSIYEDADPSMQLGTHYGTSNGPARSRVQLYVCVTPCQR